MATPGPVSEQQIPGLTEGALLGSSRQRGHPGPTDFEGYYYS